MRQNPDPMPLSLATPPPERLAARRGPAVVAGVVVSLALALLALIAGRAVARSQSALLDRAGAAGLDHAGLEALERQIRREGDLAEARTAAARFLVEREMQRPTEVHPDRLALARDLAREALERQPANAEASWILGATISMLRARERDTRLFSQSWQWERPIRRSLELAPHAKEPGRMLVGAYLDVWPALSPARREEVTRLLRDAFEDRATFERLIAPWLDLAGSLAAAAELVPDRSWAWAPLAARAGRDRDWGAFVRYDGRRRQAELRELDAALAAAESRLAQGDAGAARGALDEVLARLAPDGASAGRVERLLSQRPAGPATEPAGRAAVAWLAWAEPLELLGRESLSPEAYGRLASLAGSRLTPDRAALVALAAGDLARAELFERRSESLWSERWAPFLTLKAARALDRKAPAEARAALEQAHRDYRKRLPWQRLAREVGLPAPPPGRERWEESDWIWTDGAARLEFEPAGAASGLRLALEGVGAEGAVLEPSLDGRALEPVIVPGNAREARIATALTARPHLFELRARAGTVRPAPAVEIVR